MEDEITPEDELRAENELLKLKLEMEHGMSPSESSNLPADVENEWLNHIYEFEKAYKDAGTIKVFEFIGGPPFKKTESLSPDELSAELVLCQVNFVV